VLHSDARCEAFIGMKIQIVVIWVVMSCNDVIESLHGAYYLSCRKEHHH
jgi:hypothetical protein